MLRASLGRQAMRIAVQFCFVATFATSIGLAQPLDTQQLFEVEENVLPPVLVEGPWQHETLADYYLAANLELSFRLEQARIAFEDGQSQDCQMVTLIAGDAGIGKTFLKKKVFSKEQAASHACKIDVRELYEQWTSEGKVELRPDLGCDDTVLCSLPALRERSWAGLYEFLSQQDASFYVIDSLDEVHPDDYVWLLEQVDRFAFDSDRGFVHVVVLGRGIAFRDYWQKNAGHFATSKLNLYMLEPPEFRTVGDLLVSSWNYHRFAHELRWRSDTASDILLDDFKKWEERRFLRTGQFQQLECQPQDAIDARVEAELEKLMTRKRFAQSIFRNLAGNAVLREIVAKQVRSGGSCDERTIMEQYLNRWLVRDTKSGNRPSSSNPKHVELYVCLLEKLAAKVLSEDRVDSHGFFCLSDTESIACVHDGRLKRFSAHRILERSGLKHLDPRTPGPRRYRFEPIWLHRMLVDSYNERTLAANTASDKLPGRPASFVRSQ